MKYLKLSLKLGIIFLLLSVHVQAEENFCILPNGEILELRPTYVWRDIPGISEYFLAVSDYRGYEFEGWISSIDADCNGLSCSKTLDIPVRGKSFWSIGIKMPDNTNQYEEMTFIQTESPFPGETVLISPYKTSDTTKPTYVWKQVSDASDYYLEIRTAYTVIFSGWFSTSGANCNGDICSVTPDVSLQEKEMYRWLIQTRNSEGVLGAEPSPKKFFQVVATGDTGNNNNTENPNNPTNDPTINPFVFSGTTLKGAPKIPGLTKPTILQESIYPQVSRDINFSIFVSGNVKLVAIQLEQVDKQGNLIAYIGDLYDNGHQDSFADDGIYSGVFKITAPPTTETHLWAKDKLYFRCTVNYEGVQYVSPIAFLTVTQLRNYPALSSVDSLVTDSKTGAIFPCNEILISFKEDVSAEKILKIIHDESMFFDSWGTHSLEKPILGTILSVGIYQIKILLLYGCTPDSVYDAIQRYMKYPEVAYALPNYVTTTEELYSKETEANYKNRSPIPKQGVQYNQQFRDENNQLVSIIRANEGWLIEQDGETSTTSDTSLLIGVIDGRFDWHHPDLQDRLYFWYEADDDLSVIAARYNNYKQSIAQYNNENPQQQIIPLDNISYTGNISYFALLQYLSSIAPMKRYATANDVKTALEKEGGPIDLCNQNFFNSCGLDKTSPTYAMHLSYLIESMKHYGGNVIDTCSCQSVNDCFCDLDPWPVGSIVAQSDAEYFHGTHVTGIVAAMSRGNNKILAIRGMGTTNEKLSQYSEYTEKTASNTATFIDAINYAIKMDCKVINFSGGLATGSLDAESKANLKELLDNSLNDERGRLIIVAAGNDGANKECYPCALSALPEFSDYNDRLKNQIICVANTNLEDRLHRTPFGSNYGYWVDIAAPGVDVWSTVPTNSSVPNRQSGTSMSTPIITAAAATLWSMYPDMTPCMIKKRLTDTGRVIEETDLIIPYADGQSKPFHVPRLDYFEAVFNGSFESKVFSANEWQFTGGADIIEGEIRGYTFTPQHRHNIAYLTTTADQEENEHGEIIANLSKTFRVPEDVSSFTLSLRYNFLTEEYYECTHAGSGDDDVYPILCTNDKACKCYDIDRFNDRLEITLTDSSGTDLNWLGGKYTGQLIPYKYSDTKYENPNANDPTQEKYYTNFLYYNTSNTCIDDKSPYPEFNFSGGDDIFGYSGWESAQITIDNQLLPKNREITLNITLKDQGIKHNLVVLIDHIHLDDGKNSFTYTCPNGNCIVQTTDDLEFLSHYHTIEGNLVIDNTELRHINGLEGKTVTGDVSVQHNCALIHVEGLANTKIYGFLTISDNPELMELMNPYCLPQILSLDKQVLIENNPRLCIEDTDVYSLYYYDSATHTDISTPIIFNRNGYSDQGLCKYLRDSRYIQLY
ncbi:MAG: S8 family serine peptidase [Desulfobacterales bacterium]|nr:S8 family serine peptidase [Desulfobacterales bacterium]